MRAYGFDIETNQLSPFVGEPRMLSAAVCGPEPSERYSIGWLLDHPHYDSDVFTLHISVAEIDSYLRNPEVVLVGHNLVMFDLLWWEYVTGRKVKAQMFDTRVAQFLLDENEPNSLSDVAERWLGERADDEMKEQRARLEEVDPDDVLTYNISDAVLSRRLYEPLREALEDAGMWTLFTQYMRQYRELLSMSVRGVRVDRDWMWEHGMNLVDQEARTEQAIWDLVGKQFNIGSTKQLGEVLFDELRFPIVQRTPGGSPSTSKSALMELRSQMRGYPEARKLLALVLENRKAKKMYTAFVESYDKKYITEKNRVHPQIWVGRGSFGQMQQGARTGRLSMSNPNMQQIPRDSDIKGMFIPDEGMHLFDADYAQMELRVAAWAAGEEKMLEAFTAGLDIHTAALAELESIPYETAVERIGNDHRWRKKRAEVKSANFLILYGGGPYNLVQTLRDVGVEVSKTRARQIIDRWYEKYSRIAGWIDTVRAEIVDTVEISNVIGLRRRLPEAGAEYQEYWRQKALRQGVNFVIQSLAAQITLQALPLLSTYLSEYSGELLVTVHDSIVGQYPAHTSGLSVLKQGIQRQMTTEVLHEMSDLYEVDLTTLPIEADINLGLTRWGKE